MVQSVFAFYANRKNRTIKWTIPYKKKVHSVSGSGSSFTFTQLSRSHNNNNEQTYSLQLSDSVCLRGDPGF